MTTLGWTWQDVDEMTLPQVDVLLAYWERWPPLHQLVASYFGFGKEKINPIKLLPRIPGGVKVKAIKHG